VRYFSLVVILPIVLLSACAHQNAVAPLPGVGATATTSDLIYPAATFKLLYTFKSRPDGAKPEARLAAIDGAFYGTTRYGGTDDVGTVFEVKPDGTEKVLHSFSLSNFDGLAPLTGLVPRHGALYGATHGGGKKGTGVFYEIKRDGTLKILHDFETATGSYPVGELFSLGSAFYGVTSNGGAHDLGTVYSITATGHYTLMHSFGGGADGARPEGGVELLDHHFYGTTSEGGAHNFGTVYEIAPDGKEKVIYSFTYGGDDGGNPEAEIVSLNGALYGTTFRGGLGGTIFEVKKDGTERVVHSMKQNQGRHLSGLTVFNGALYGTAARGGSKDHGTIFEVKPDGTFSLLHTFGIKDGSEPRASLLLHDGKLYGTTASGGASYKGVVFEVTP